MSPEHLAANSAVGRDLTAVGQERIDLDQMRDAEACGFQHLQIIVPEYRQAVAGSEKTYCKAGVYQ